MKLNKKIFPTMIAIFSLFMPIIAIGCDCDSDSKNIEEINPALIYNEEDNN